MYWTDALGLMSLESFLTNPKSPILTWRDSVRKMLCGFKSRWTILQTWWICQRPLMISFRSRIASDFYSGESASTRSGEGDTVRMILVIPAEAIIPIPFFFKSWPAPAIDLYVGIGAASIICRCWSYCCWEIESYWESWVGATADDDDAPSTSELVLVTFCAETCEDDVEEAREEKIFLLRFVRYSARVVEQSSVCR